MKKLNESEVYQMLVQWGEDNDCVRTMILTSSRVLPKSQPDIFSDYDVELYVNDPQFFNNDDWLKTFGTIMVRWPLEPMTTWSKDWLTRLVLYEKGLKIDFQIADLTKVKPTRYDSGYKILLDKDNLTKELPEPTYQEFNVKKPTAAEFAAVVNEFFWETTYVAKSLWRDELYFAKFSLDYVIRFECLQKMIEWYIGSNNNWRVNTKTSGRAFKQFLGTEDWKELETTYAGANVEDNWQALFNVIQFFRRIAKDVAHKLGYEYLDELDSKVTEYCKHANIIERK